MGLINSIKSKFSSKSDEISELLNDDDVKEAFSSFIKINRWSVFLFLIMIAASMAAYVGNVLAVNNLYKEIRVLEDRKKRILNTNNVLEARVIELQSAKRIIPIAEENLNMIKAGKPPRKIK